MNRSLAQKFVLPIGAFGLAFLLWIFVVSGNTYSTIMKLPIEARNLNAQKAHEKEVPLFASVRLRGTGRDLFKSFLLKNFAGFKLVLDLEGISKEYEFILNEYFEKYPQKVVLQWETNDCRGAATRLESAECWKFTIPRHYSCSEMLISCIPHNFTSATR